MRYIKCFEYYVPYGDYLINGDTEIFEKVEGFMHYYKMDLSLLELWIHTKNNYNVYPSKISKDEILYITEDGCKIIIKLFEGSIDYIEKIKIEHGMTGITHKKIFKGKYSLNRFDKLIDV